MAELGTLELIARELGRAFQPIEDRLKAGEVRTLFAELGLQFPPQLETQAAFVNTLAAAVTEAAKLPPLIVQLTTAIENEDIAAAVQTAGDLINVIRSLLTAIDQIGPQLNAISGTLPGMSQADVLAFAADLSASLVEFMLVTYLESNASIPVHLLGMLGVVEITRIPAVPGDPTKPAFTRRRLALNRIGELLSSPENTLNTMYGWGANFNKSDLFFERLHDLLFALDIPALYERASGPGTVPSLNILLFRIKPKLDIAPAGLEATVEFTLDDGLAEEVPFFLPGLSLILEIKGKLEAGLGVIISPPANVTLIPPGGTLDGHANLRLAGVPQAPKTAIQLFGQAEGTRVEAAKFSAALLTNFRWQAPSGPAKGDIGFEFKIEHGKIVVSLAGADGFLASVLPPEGFNIPFDFLIGWSGERGVYFDGGAALETSIPIHADLGPISLDSVHLLLGVSTTALNLDIGVTGGITLGPISASVQDIGVRIALEFHRGNLGPLELAFRFKPPTGLGIAIDAGPITGGGFISFDEPNARYAGILQLKLMEIGVTAIGLLDTCLPGGQPGYSFLIIIAVNLPPIQLSFGFVLTGIGGLMGINRTVVIDAITQGLRNGILDHIMFPPDPIRNAPQIISDLRTIFPPVADRYVFGPMLQLAWGTPSLIICQLGVILEVPDPVRILIIGQLKMALPTEDVALVEIHIDVLGFVDFGRKLMGIDASMHDSRVTIYSVYGDMSVRLSWGDPPSFAVSMGGWNPHFTPPPGMPELRRLTIAIGLGDNPRYTCQSYFAVTSNSFQFGARAELYAEAGGFNLRGWIGFDALVIFSPFSFVVDISAGVELRHGSSVIAGIHLSGHLAGPNPWHIWGEACLSLFFFDICVGFDVEIGDKKPEDLPTADPWPLLEAAIKKPESWSATIPAGGARAVSLAIPPGSTPPVLVDPLGGISLHEKVLPLNRKITKFGEARPIGPDHYNVTAVRVGAAPAPSWALVKDYFAIGQFQELSDPEKLSRPSFEPMDAGVSVASDAAAHGGSLGIDVVYETIIVDAPDLIRFVGIYALALATQMSMTSRSAAATAPIWKTGLNTYNPGLDAIKPFKDAETIYTVASTVDLSGRFDIGQGTIGETHDALNAYLETHPGERSELQVIPLHELEVA
jgi:hypothetical protein